MIAYISAHALNGKKCLYLSLEPLNLETTELQYEDVTKKALFPTSVQSCQFFHLPNPHTVNTDLKKSH